MILLKSLFLQIHRSIWLLLLLNLFNFAPSLKFDIFNSSWIKPPFICLQDQLLWNWHSSTLICICAEPSLPLSYLSSLMSFCFWAIILTGVLICQMKSKRPELLSLCLKIHPFFNYDPFNTLIRWQESLSRFKHIFGFKNQARYKDIPVYYLSGNHDIGYSSLHSDKPEVFKNSVEQSTFT